MGPHESVQDFLRSAWDPRTALLIVAVLFVAAVQIAGPWAYTDMLGDLAHGRTEHILARGALFVALLGVMYLRSSLGSRIAALRG